MMLPLSLFRASVLSPSVSVSLTLYVAAHSPGFLHVAWAFHSIVVSVWSVFLTLQMVSKTVHSKQEGEKMPVQLQAWARAGTVLFPCILIFEVI